jgi:hypothetical protein
MHKRLLLATAFVLTTLAAQAQFQVGLKAGVTRSTTRFTPEPLDFLRGRTDFHAGAFAVAPLSERVSFQPELLYSRQGFSIGGNNLATVNLHYIQVPALLNVYLTEGLALQAGPQVGYLADARVGVGNWFSISYGDAFQKWDASLVGGLQYELPGGLTLSGRYVHGLSNINRNFDLVEAFSLNDLVRMRNAGFQVSVGYKF